MAVRRPLIHHTFDDDLRKRILELLRSDDPLSTYDREMIASQVDKHWRSDPKRNKPVQRRKDADAINTELKSLVESGMSATEARETVARKWKHNSPAALDKWLRRARRRTA